MNKILIAYFSASGETGKLAKTLSAVTGGDLFEIRPETTYTSADLNWMDKQSRSTIEMKDAGKTVIPFATSGGSGMGKTADILRAVCPAANILPGKRMSARESAEAVRAWLETLRK